MPGALIACIIESATSSGFSISCFGNLVFNLSQNDELIAPGKTEMIFILNSLNSFLKLSAKPLKPNFDETYAAE